MQKNPEAPKRLLWKWMCGCIDEIDNNYHGTNRTRIERCPLHKLKYRIGDLDEVE